MRIGRIERRILLGLLYLNRVKEEGRSLDDLRVQGGCSRDYKEDAMPSLYVRNYVFRWRAGPRNSERVSFSRAMRALERKGLVILCRFSEDEPAYYLKLTERGCKHVLKLFARIFP